MLKLPCWKLVKVLCVLACSAMLSTANILAAPNEARARQITEEMRAGTRNLSNLQELVDLISQSGWNDLGLLDACLGEVNSSLKKGIRSPAISNAISNWALIGVPVYELTSEQFVKRLHRKLYLDLNSATRDMQHLLEQVSSPELRLVVIRAMTSRIEGDSPRNGLFPNGGEVQGDGPHNWLDHMEHETRSPLGSSNVKLIGLIRAASAWDVDVHVRQAANKFIIAIHAANQPTPGLDINLARIRLALWHNMQNRSLGIKDAIATLAKTELGGVCGGAVANWAAMVGAPARLPSFVDIRRATATPNPKMN